MTVDATSGATPADQVSPDELLSGFANSHLVRWFLAALLLHAIVIGGFSVGTIRDWLDPEGATARKAAAVAAAKPASTPAEPPQAAASQPATPADAAPGPAQAAAEATTAEAKSPIEKAATEAAKPEEIPTAPDDLGLSIEDTNPK